MRISNGREPNLSRQSAALIARVDGFIRDHQLIDPGDGVLVGVSGGPDSVALLHVLHVLRTRWRLRLVVCHLNHLIRDESAFEDATFVEALAQSLQLPVVLRECDVQAIASRKRIGLEEAGRLARYDLFWETANDFRLRRVALGHNKEDQVETIVHHLIRGAGLDGLEGMPLIRDIYIRPLLDTSRREIIDFLNSGRLKYRVDPSNRNHQFLRNKIRLDLLPLLSEYNPKMTENLYRLSGLVREDRKYLEDQTELAISRMVEQFPGRCQFGARDLQDLPKALQNRLVLRLLRSLLPAGREVGSIHVKQVFSLTESGKSGKKVRLPGGLWAWRQFDAVVISVVGPRTQLPFDLELSIPGSIAAPSGTWRLSARYQDMGSSDKTGNTSPFEVILVSGEQVRQLRIRSVKPGDWYQLRHKKKIKKVWSDAKVPLELRSQMPLVFKGDRLVWIPGFLPSQVVFGVRETDKCTQIGLKLDCAAGSSLNRWLASRTGI